MQGTLHFGDDLEERANYKKIVVEAMLQHYGVRTYCHDFVDNHWTALWFSLYELKKEREKDQSKKTDYYNYYYQKRKPFLNKKCPKPACLELDAVKKYSCQMNRIMKMKLILNLKSAMHIKI